MGRKAKEKRGRKKNIGIVLEQERRGEGWKSSSKCAERNRTKGRTCQIKCWGRMEESDPEYKCAAGREKGSEGYKSYERSHPTS